MPVFVRSAPLQTLVMCDLKFLDGFRGVEPTFVRASHFAESTVDIRAGSGAKSGDR